MISTGSLLPAGLDQALHRCITVASQFGTIRLTRPRDASCREFELELDDIFAARLRWTLKTSSRGTELSISRPAGLRRFARRVSALDRQLDRRLRLLPHLASLKIAVLGGGTGLYTTLLGLRDRSWNLTAVISGLKRGAELHVPKDQLGFLPGDDGSLCLVALAPTVEENVVLRRLLSHRLESRDWRGAHFGTALLRALEEIGGSRRAALDAAAELLGVHGRIIVALESNASAQALLDADLIVLAPGHLQLDLIPVLCCPGVIDAIRRSQAIKAVVTKIMTAEGSGEVARTSAHVRPLAELIGMPFDLVLANAGPLTEGQLRVYAAAGSAPIEADVEETMQYAGRVITEPLSAAGDLARHDPDQLGQCLVETAAEQVLARAEGMPQRGRMDPEVA